MEKCIFEENMLILWVQGFPSFTQITMQDIAQFSAGKLSLATACYLLAAFMVHWWL